MLWMEATSTWKMSARRRIFSGSSRRMARTSSLITSRSWPRPHRFTARRTTSADWRAVSGERGVPSLSRNSSMPEAVSDREQR